MTQRRFDPGTVLADKYRLDALLGEGGMGTVYRATHLLLQAPVAIKLIDREVSAGDVVLARFMREAQAAASLRSPHVVQVLDYGSTDGLPFMVMELLEGETLAARIQRLGRLSPRETYRIMSHVSRAVARAHESGIVHRDLKPDNVFLVDHEGELVAKVLDFGVAKIEATALGGDSHTRTGSLLGTPYYMSPEQAQGNKEVDFRSDLWALGVIAFECLIGERPFYSEGLGEVVLQICVRDIPRPSERAEVPPGFDAWFFHATERDPGARFQSARELSEALRMALDIPGDPNGPLPESAWSTAAALPPVVPVGERTTQPNGEDATISSPPPSASDAHASPSRPSSESPSSESRSSESPSRIPSEAPIPEGARVVVGERGARWEESVEPQLAEDTRASSWKVVPVGPSDRPPPPELAVPHGLGTDLLGSRAARIGIFGVAALAVFLGAAAVLLAREYGSHSLVTTLRGETIRVRSKPRSGAKPQPESHPKSSSLSLTKRSSTSSKASKSPGPTQGVDSATDGSAEEAGPVREDDALDALEHSIAEEPPGPDGSGVVPPPPPTLASGGTSSTGVAPDAPLPEATDTGSPSGHVSPPNPPANPPPSSPP